MSEKYILPHRPNAIFPADEYALKTTPRPGMASYRKSLLPSHSLMETSYSCFMDSKYKCLRCEMPIVNKCSVFEENEDVEKGNEVNALHTARLRPDLSTAFRQFANNSQQQLAVHRVNSMGTRAYSHIEVRLAKQDRRRVDVCFHARIKSTLCHSYYKFIRRDQDSTFAVSQLSLIGKMSRIFPNWVFMNSKTIFPCKNYSKKHQIRDK